MFDTLFGAEVPIGAKILLGLVVVFGIIGLVAWIVRRFGADRFGGPAGRGRQPRLAVVDKLELGAGRMLVMIRRDNVEHLVMMGGKSDFLIEPNIVRAMVASRDKMDTTLGRSLSLSETLTRPVPLGEGTTTFPLQPTPETNGRPPRAAADDSAQWTWPTINEPQRPTRGEEPQRPARAEPRMEKPDAMPAPPEEMSPRTPAAPLPREPNLARPAAPPPPASRPAPTPAAAPVPPMPSVPPAMPSPPAAAPPAPAPVAAEKPVRPERPGRPAKSTEPDKNLADMATLLGASLRRAGETSIDTPTTTKIEPVKTGPMEPPAPPRRTPPEPRVAPSPEPKPAIPEAKKPVFDTLEEEMASLLGRPPGKT